MSGRHNIQAQDARVVVKPFSQKEILSARARCGRDTTVTDLPGSGTTL